jgi:hypothetical protein
MVLKVEDVSIGRLHAYKENGYEMLLCITLVNLYQSLHFSTTLCD